MRRLDLLTLCATASLLLCVIVCLLWVRSQRLRATQFRDAQQGVLATRNRELALDQAYARESTTSPDRALQPEESHRWDEQKWQDSRS